ncbi:MAG TPA: hypothetical protein VLA64_13740 [Azonexus sp.]|nr:hypothetical protein [Azonexus sp.]
MLKLFQSIFGGNEGRGRYPESLIEMATERAVDGTYPRLRAVPGYQKRLREPVIHAIDHAIAIVDSLPAPLPAVTAEYANDPRLPALFVSPEHMREVFGNDPFLGEFRANHPDGGERVTALLLAERKEKNTLGVEMGGEILRRDVAQVSVSFRNHRLVDPAINEEEARRQLKRRAFDHLISLALWRISEAKGERAELNHQRELLRSKLSVLQKGGWSFESAGGEQTDSTKLQSELDDIEGQLAAFSVDDRTLSGQLDIVSEVLLDAEKQFWAEPVDLFLDRMNIKRDAQNPDARPVSFHELHNARGEKLAMLFVLLNPSELPQRASFASNADRALAELGSPFQR